ncbi:MAG: restriction endonuclease [Candidatus Cloacimonadaceae bacterium]|nr:restriction endonuclease [Candidatus Cloacimonadaceae bacterium]
MKNTGREYEELVQQVFKVILGMDKLKTIRLERNVRIDTKTGPKQEIDIYWEYQVGINPNPNIVLFQAKDWKNKVAIEHLRAFKNVIDDIPGHPTGIFVTKTGYQSGAKKFAKNNGIPIWELREPTDVDWENRISEIHLTYHFLMPEVQTEFVQDNEWNHNKLVELGLNIYEGTISSMADQIVIYDGNYLPTRVNVHKLQNEYIKKCSESNQEICEFIHTFEFVTFINTSDPTFPFLKISCIKFKVMYHETLREEVIRGVDTVKYRLYECLSGTLFTVKQDGSIIKHDNKDE